MPCPLNIVFERLIAWYRYELFGWMILMPCVCFHEEGEVLDDAK